MALTLIRPTGSTLVCTLPPGNIVAVIMPDGAYRLSGLLDWCGFIGPAYLNPVFAFIALITAALSATYCCKPLARR